MTAAITVIIIIKVLILLNGTTSWLQSNDETLIVLTGIRVSVGCVEDECIVVIAIGSRENCFEQSWNASTSYP